jgi:hypothetical protein
MEQFNRSAKEVASPKIQRDLAILEDQEGGINCKFGVVYARAGQLSDVQMLANEFGAAILCSPYLKIFLHK